MLVDVGAGARSRRWPAGCCDEGFRAALLAGCAIAFAGRDRHRRRDDGARQRSGRAARCSASSRRRPTRPGVVAQKPLLERAQRDVGDRSRACAIGADRVPAVHAGARSATSAPPTARRSRWTVYLGVFPTRDRLHDAGPSRCERTTAGKMGATTYLVPPVARAARLGARSARRRRALAFARRRAVPGRRRAVAASRRTRRARARRRRGRRRRSGSRSPAARAAGASGRRSSASSAAAQRVTLVLVGPQQQRRDVEPRVGVEQLALRADRPAPRRASPTTRASVDVAARRRRTRGGRGRARPGCRAPSASSPRSGRKRARAGVGGEPVDARAAPPRVRRGAPATRLRALGGARCRRLGISTSLRRASGARSSTARSRSSAPSPCPPTSGRGPPVSTQNAAITSASQSGVYGWRGRSSESPCSGRSGSTRRKRCGQVLDDRLELAVA